MEKTWYVETIRVIVGFLYLFWVALVVDLIICKVFGGATPFMFKLFRVKGKKGGQDG